MLIQNPLRTVEEFIQELLTEARVEWSYIPSYPLHFIPFPNTPPASALHLRLGNFHIKWYLSFGPLKASHSSIEKFNHKHTIIWSQYF